MLNLHSVLSFFCSLQIFHSEPPIVLYGYLISKDNKGTIDQIISDCFWASVP